jgi:hypothetical protein
MKRATKTISFRVNHEVAGLIETARKPFGLSAGEYVRGIITRSLDSFSGSSTENDLAEIRQALAELTAENLALQQCLRRLAFVILTRTGDLTPEAGRDAVRQIFQHQDTP